METENTFENLVVLDNIFNNLSFSDLLTCRKVCRLWNTEITKIIARRQSCIIQVRGQYPCSALSRLQELLTSSCVTFASVFIGISIDIDSSFREDNCINYCNHLYENLLNNLPPDLKYLRLSWSQTDNCAVQELSYNLLRKYENSLEELVLRELRELHRILRHSQWTFTNLKTLRLENYTNITTNHRRPRPRDIRTLLYQFLERAEKLELIHGIKFSSLQQVPPSKLDAIWALEYDINDYLRRPQEPEELYARFAAKKRQLGYLAIRPLPDINSNCTTLCKLMEGSKKTLKSIYFDCPFVRVTTQCLRSGLGPLPSVQEIDIGLRLDDTIAEIRSKIAQLIFYVFPNLKIVFLHNWNPGWEDYEEIFRQFRTHVPVNHVGSRVNSLLFVDSYHPHQSPISLELVRDLFPNVTDLDYEASGYADLQSVSNMWTTWPQLVQLYVKGEASITSDFDAEFCGISSQEADYLRSQSAEFLEKVHIVPIRPAMYFLKDLRKLGMEDRDRFNLGMRRRTLDLLTEVTGHVVFKRVHDLDIQVTGAEQDQGLRRLCDAGFIELDNSYERRRNRRTAEMWLIV